LSAACSKSHEYPTVSTCLSDVVYQWFYFCTLESSIPLVTQFSLSFFSCFFSLVSPLSKSRNVRNLAYLHLLTFRQIQEYEGSCIQGLRQHEVSNGRGSLHHLSHGWLTWNVGDLHRYRSFDKSALSYRTVLLFI